MTATVTKNYDVFISHAASDTHLAVEIAESLESAGLETFHGGSIEPGGDVSDAIWQALAESRALIAVISPEVPPQAMGMVEIGAAAAWNKPVFLLINGPSTTKLPPALSGYPVYPLSRLEDVIRAIRSGFDPLTDEERELLAEIYRDLNTPSDQLSQSPTVLHELTAHFNKHTRKHYSGERLLSELIRMRKKG
jgi:hypothetical protein